jgi:hypothetical protein
MGFDFRTHTTAGIADSQQDIVTRLGIQMALHIIIVDDHIARFNGQLAACGHCITGIDHQVSNDLLELGRICFDRPQVRGQDRFQMNIFTDDALQQFVQLGHDGIKVQYLGLDNLLAAEGQ